MIFLGDLFKQLSALAELHAEVDVLCVIIRLVVPHDVWVVHLLHDGDLSLKTQYMLGLHTLFVYHFDGENV